jgi:uncharacterized protein YbjT (DUF2867 family)
MTEAANSTGLVLVTGGTGTLGRRVVDSLVKHGRDVRVLTRRPRQQESRTLFIQGDLLKPEGLTAALEGVSVIIHCASARKGDAEATRHLVGAASAMPRPPHLVFISIVGADRVSFGYTRTKLEAEDAVASSGLPWTILRATQFYDMLLAGAANAAKLPVVPVPAGFRVQPVDAGEVAERLVLLALGEPAGRVPDLGGPNVVTAADLIRTYLRLAGRKRPVVEFPLPGTRAVRAGALLVQQPAAGQGVHSWEEFLATKLK